MQRLDILADTKKKLSAKKQNSAKGLESSIVRSNKDFRPLLNRMIVNEVMKK